MTLMRKHPGGEVEIRKDEMCLSPGMPELEGVPLTKVSSDPSKSHRSKRRRRPGTPNPAAARRGSVACKPLTQGV